MRRSTFDSGKRVAMMVGQGAASGELLAVPTVFSSAGFAKARLGKYVDVDHLLEGMPARDRYAFAANSISR